MSSHRLTAMVDSGFGLVGRFVLVTTDTAEVCGVSTGNRVAVLMLPVVAMLVAAGCGDGFSSGPITYVRSEKLTTDLAGKPAVQATVVEILDETFGASPREMKAPEGAPLVDGGRLLGTHVIDLSEVGEGGPTPAAKRISRRDPGTGEFSEQAGGYALYRKHCLHCHGVSGDGMGPTAEFLFPRPRDYRPGIFKFTSTSGEKPTRDDMIRTLREGIPNTSMPAFDALMTRAEMEQVTDYVIFLSLRGQTERMLAEEAAFDEALFEDEEAASELAQEVVQMIFAQWVPAAEGGENEVVLPEVPRLPASRESVLRGRELYLGLTPEKLQCAGCHGAKGRGDGPSFVPVDVFNAVVFRGKPITSFDEATQRLWSEGSLDSWGQPLRPANINNGERTMYKGGRRPIDLYWRIAKGINGAKMPAHNTLLKPEQIWDVVNFVLAVPYQPELLPETMPVPAPAQEAEPAPARVAANQ